MSGSLACMNCKQETSTENARFFAEVFLCPSCYDKASHFYVRTERELRYLLVVAKEAIRIALVEGRFDLPEAPTGEPSKREVLQEILRIEELREQRAKR